MLRRRNILVTLMAGMALLSGCGTQAGMASLEPGGVRVVAIGETGSAYGNVLLNAVETDVPEAKTGTTVDMKLYTGDVLPVLTMLGYLMNNDMTSTRIEAGYDAAIGSGNNTSSFMIRAAFANFESSIKDQPYQEFKGGYALIHNDFKVSFEIGTGTLEGVMEERDMLAAIMGVSIPVKAGGYGFTTDVSWEYNHDENQFGSSFSDNKFRIGLDFPIVKVLTLGLIYGRVENNNSDFAMNQLAFKMGWNIWKTLSTNLLLERYESAEGADWENHGVFSIQYGFASGVSAGLGFLSVKQDGVDGTTAMSIYGAYKF
jgi:hypothetical protein